MATQQQRDRQHRAMHLVQRRIDFWEQPGAPFHHDGKDVDPDDKLAKARQEKDNLIEKGVRDG